MDLMAYLGLEAQLREADRDKLQSALREVLAPALGAAFGAGRAADHELATLKALQTLGVLPEQVTEFDLVMQLRVTRAKARSLLYRAQLAALDSLEGLDDRVREVVAHPTVERVGQTGGGKVEWILDVPDPLVADRIRQLVRQNGYVSDGSFSPSLIRLSLRAYAKLVESLIPQDRREGVLAEAKKRAEWAHRRELREVLEDVLARAVKVVASAGGGGVGEAFARELLRLLKEGATSLFDGSAPGGGA